MISSSFRAHMDDAGQTVAKLNLSVVRSGCRVGGPDPVGVIAVRSGLRIG